MIIQNLNTKKEIIVIAEIGNNHEGNYALAKKMIGLAAQAGAGAVKFQTIIPEKLISSLQKERIKQLKRFQLTYDEFKKLSNVAKKKNILFLSTPFDIESAKFLEPLVSAYKIASGDNNFYPMIEVIAKTGKPIIMSTGLMEFKEIKKSIDFINKIWKKNGIKQDLAILHCVAAYPTPLDQANLLSIKQLQGLNVTVGYSDHTLGIQAATLAVALGARIIEKHFTIDKNYSNFHDHQLSADPKEMKLLIENIKIAQKLLGQDKKKIQNSEKDNLSALRRSIVAKRDLIKNEIISKEDITWTRPGGGISPGQENLVIGKRTKQNIKKGAMVLSKIIK
ncbi:MAG: N-acetylneuraminate synthase family protein [Promethearchaeota archaeon]